MITEDYVSFETAKLLKEKGFDGICRTAYETITNEHEVEQCSLSSWGKLNQAKRPTLQMAMKWLREVYNIDIMVWVENYNGVKRYTSDCWKDVVQVDSQIHRSKRFPSYEEACEAAIKYCLENLI